MRVGVSSPVMFRRIFPLLAIAVLALPLLTPRAMAATVINFDSLANGTTVTNQFPQATFSSTPGKEFRTSSSSLAHTAPHHIVGFALSEAGPGGAFDFFAELIVDFTNPVNNLSFFATAVNNNGTIGSIDVFQNGSFTTAVNLVGDGSVTTADLQNLSVYASITRIRVHGITDASGIGYDTFSFNTAVSPVPLPAALPLYGTGLAIIGLLGWRRRRRAAVAA